MKNTRNLVLSPFVLSCLATNVQKCTSWTSWIPAWGTSRLMMAKSTARRRPSASIATMNFANCSWRIYTARKLLLVISLLSVSIEVSVLYQAEIGSPSKWNKSISAWVTVSDFKLHSSHDGHELLAKRTCFQKNIKMLNKHLITCLLCMYLIIYTYKKNSML